MPRGLSSRTIEILDLGFAFIKSVDYKVSLRWVFYRLVQALGLAKKDYGSFKAAASKARKRRLRGWHPDILADETRKIYDPNIGHSSLEEWVKAVRSGVRCNLDKHIGQRYNVQVWFEAKAMAQQFRKYTGPYYVPLAPFGGDASIPFKKKIADSVTRVAKNGKPVVVLYFGDLDPKGLQIPKSALKDIREWTPVEFEFIRVGLNLEHARAKSLDRYIDLKKIEKIRKVEERAEAYLRSYLQEWDSRELLDEDMMKIE